MLVLLVILRLGIGSQKEADQKYEKGGTINASEIQIVPVDSVTG